MQRALPWSALFLCTALAAGPIRAECPRLPVDRWVGAVSVVDGDTLRLTDGDRVRVVGIDAPELARDDRPGQPLGPEARDAAVAFLGPESRAGLVFGPRKRDRYGRLLVHVYAESGTPLAAALVAAGLAFAIAVPPDTRLAECLARAEAGARQARRGVWGHPAFRPREAAEIDAADTGFRLVRGRIERVDRGRGRAWLELDGPLVLRLDPAALEGLGDRDPVGMRIEARGWLIDREARRTLKPGYRRFLIDVRHPNGIVVVPDH